MKINGSNNTCPFTDEIVSYMYDELHGAERTKFETHLADCMACTDDFAAVANARFSVFEWRKEEFAHLPTPEIVIPYALKKAVIEENVAIGFLAGLRGWLSLVNFPITVAAVLVITVGLGFLATTYLGGDQQTVADANVPAIATQDNKAIVGSNDIPVPDITKKTMIGVTTVSKDITTIREIRPVKAVAIRPTRLERQMTANSIPVQDSALKMRKAPVLSNYDDNDDRSLRLTDLFDEDGG